jgi:hypothetical protein
MFNEKFLEKYPLSTSYIQGVFKTRIIKVLEELDVPEGIREDLILSSMNDERLIETLEGNPCVLFDIFDSAGIHFFVYPFKENGKTSYAHASINESSFLTDSNGTSSRKLAEQHAVRECFEHLEHLLSSKKVSHGDTVSDV